MSQRSVIVRLEAEVANYVAGMERAARATEEVVRRTTEMQRQSTTQRQSMEAVGKGMMTVGTAAVAGLGLASKAAMDWESAWAGVTKTVDGSPEQMAELEEGLRNLATTLPATHEEIAGVAEAAGQLGVKREDVLGFTEQMIALGETTNLTADEAATSIAQISNVMGTMARDGSEGVERFSATLVALGNAGASTEAEILEMAKRLVGAGKLIGASESDVLALSNAMASVGIEAQLGGGVMSRVMQRMYADVQTGGEGLENLAKVAGVSSKDFAAAFESDPVRAVDMMVKGLGRVKDEGGNVMETMDGLGIKGTEETSVILRLAGAGDLLADSLKLGDEAWKSNSALAEEAAKRYETTESKVKVAWNNIKDAAIEAGAVLLPLIAGAAEGAAGVAKAFGALPDPVKGALTILGGVAGVAALGGGAFLSLVPKVRDARDAFDQLAPAGGRARTSIDKVAKAAGGAMALGTFAGVLAKIAEAEYLSEIDTGMGKVADVLADVASNSPDAAAGLDSLFKDRDGGDLIGTVTDLESAIKRTFNRDAGQQFNDWGESMVSAIFPVKGSSHMLADSFSRLDQGLADLVSGGKADDAAEAFQRIQAAAADQGVSVEELAAKFPQYGDALRAASADAKNAATDGDAAAGAIGRTGEAAAGAAPITEEVAEALAEVGVSADGAVTDLVKFTDALLNAGLLQLSARDAARGFEEAIDAVTTAATTNGKTLDINTEKGRANQAALDAVAGAGFRVVQANAANGESQKVLQGNLKTTYDNLVTSAKALGATDDEAIALARDLMGIPPGVNVNSWMSSAAKTMAEQTGAAVRAVDGQTANIYITTHRAEVITVSRSESVSTGRGTKAKGPLAYAGGGEIDGPGPKGVDSELILAAPGEHMLTAREVDIMGGHDAVYRFRANVRAGTFQALAGGGAVGTPVAATQLMTNHAAATPARLINAPDVRVFIGNEQINARIEVVAEGVLHRADSQSQFMRKGR